MSLSTGWSWFVDAVGYAFLLAVASSHWWIPGLKAVASKWLDARFAEKLKEADRVFQKQLKDMELKHDVMARHLQSTIDREFHRATQLHNREFEALSLGWELADEAYWRA